MSEPEELIADAARHATVFARDLWRRHRGPAEKARRVTLADVAPRLDYLITAVFGAGRRIRIAQPPAPGTLLRQTFGADRGPRTRHAVPATDGVSIWLPSETDLDDAGLADLCYRTMALAQVLRARRGAAANSLATRAGLTADLYLLLEAYAADAALATMLPGLVPSIDLLRRIALERRPPAESFPPRRYDVERLTRVLLECPAAEPIASLVTSSPAASADLAARIAAELQSRAGTHRFGAEPLLKDWWTGALHAPSTGDATLVPGRSADLDGDSEKPSRVARLRRRPERRDALEDEDDEQEDPGIVGVQQDDPHPHAEDPMGLRRPVDRDEDVSADQLGDMVSDMPEARTIASPAPPKEVLLSDDPPDARTKLDLGDDASPDGSCLFYPEWDYRKNAYREPGAGVRPSTAPPGPDEWVDATLAEQRALLEAVRRRFEMLHARRVRLRRQLDGDDVDLDACVEHYADLAAGHASHEGLYTLRRPIEHDLAVMLLIDISGSTDAWVDADRRVIDVEREALLVVSVALESLGEPFAIEAFSGEGPQHVMLRCVKRFDEPYGRPVALRVAGLEPERYTRAGAALRHATSLLMRRRAQHRLLLLLSDGKPNDVDDYEGRYGVEDLRQAVVEAKLQGIFPFCVTIDRHAASYLPRVFGAHQYALLSEPARLPEVLVDWIKRLLAV